MSTTGLPINYDDTDVCGIYEGLHAISPDGGRPFVWGLLSADGNI